MKKLLTDLMKSPSGKYSRKSFLLLTTFSITMLLAIFIVISDKILDKEVNRYAIDVFDSLLLFIFALCGITTADKKLENKSVPNVTEENNE